MHKQASPGGCTGLRPLTLWGCVLESRRVHGCLSLVIDVFCQEQVLRIPIDCCVFHRVWSRNLDTQEALEP